MYVLTYSVFFFRVVDAKCKFIKIRHQLHVTYGK